MMILTKIQYEVLSDMAKDSYKRPPTIQETADRTNRLKPTVYASRIRLRELGYLDDRFLPTQKAIRLLSSENKQMG